MIFVLKLKLLRKKRKIDNKYKLFERIDVDLFVAPKRTYDGKKYLMVLTDFHSRMSFTYLLKKKSDAYPNIKQFVKLIEEKFN